MQVIGIILVIGLILLVLFNILLKGVDGLIDIIFSPFKLILLIIIVVLAFNLI